jgi:hypothetical protein
MLKREYKWKGLNILEIHYLDNVSKFMENYNLKNIDVIKLCQVNENYKNKLDEFHTLHIDLEDSEDDIFKKFHSNSRNEIRKNLKDDNVTFHSIEVLSEIDVDNFIKDLDIFMGQKEHSVDTNFQLQQLKDYKSNIILTEVKKDDTVLASHLYLFDDKRARYKSGISFRMNKNIDPKVVGRANRGLHWFDIKLLQNKGLKLYDLGGIAHNTEDKAKININKFKEKFTKNQVIEYQGNIGISLKGKLALFVHKVLQKIKR